MNKNVKTMVLVAILGVGVALTACSKKKTTCECTITVKVMGQTQTQTVTGEIESGSCEDMPEAKKAVEDANKALAGYGTASISCK
jgi:uncharacterized protein YggE